MQPSESITQLLVDWSHGDQKALDKLMPLVYGELRRLASNYLRRERQNHTLQPTALINELYLRVIRNASVDWQSRAHFYAVAAATIRRILVDHARAQAYQKRGGGAEKLELNEAMVMAQERAAEVGCA